MKTFLRTLAIVAAALVVVGLTIALGNTAFGQSLRAQGPMGGHGGRERFEHHEGEFRPGMFEGQRPEGFPRDGQRPEGFPRGGEGRGDHGPSLFGLTEVVKNLVKIGLIVALVVVGGRLLGWGRRGTPRRRPPAEGAAPQA